MRSSPSRNGKAAALPPWKGSPSIRPSKSIVTRSSSPRLRSPTAIGPALLAQDVERVVDRRVVNFQRRPLDFHRRHVADLDLRVDFEGGAELERGGVRRPSSSRSAGGPPPSGSLSFTASWNAFSTALPSTSDRTCGPYCCTTISSAPCQGGTRQFHVAGELLEAVDHLTLHVLHGHRHRHAPLQRAQVLHIHRHSGRFPFHENWCEGSDSNRHAVRRQDLNLVRLPIPPPSRRPTKASRKTTYYSLQVSVGHYENFPVASLLLPRELREPVGVIYRFARTADDFADEGNDAARDAAAEAGAFELNWFDFQGRIPKPPFRGRGAHRSRARTAAAAVSRPAGCVLAGCGEKPLCGLCRGARLQPALRQSRRQAPSASVPEGISRKLRLLRPHLLGTAAHQLLAGRAQRLRDGIASICRRTRCARFGVTEEHLRQHLCDAAFRS